MVAWAVAAVLLVLAAVRVLDGGGGGAAPPPVRVDGGGVGPDPGRTGGAAKGPRIYVHVAGEVLRPGLLRVPEGSRAAAAIARAGGPTDRAELTAVNLAQQLEDGQQLIVPRRLPGVPGGVVASAGAGSVAPGEPGSVPLSLATATPEQLEQLDGIGPTLAERIIEYRDENGGIRSLGQLQEVEGIGEKRYESLSEAVRP